MTLLELYNKNPQNYSTDKNTVHCYISEYYSSAFDGFECKNLLELGVATGGSLKLWRDYFTEAKIYGLNIGPVELKENDRIEIKQIDAYTKEVHAYLDNKKFDIIVDDGPHTLKSMIFFCEHYPNYLTENGIAVIEDIPSYKWIPQMVQKLDPNLFKHRLIDLKHVKNRFDDVMLEIKRVKV